MVTDLLHPPAHRAGAVGLGAAWPMFRVAVRDRLVLVLVTSAVMVLMGLMVGSLWPSLQDALADMTEVMPEAILVAFAAGDMGSAEGWVNAEMLSFTAPVAVLVVGALSGARATAGEEQDGTMGLLLSAPVGRGRVLLAKATATAAHVAGVCAAVVVGMWLGSLVGGMDLAWSGMLAVGLHLFALGLVFGALGLALGAATGSRRLGGALTSAVGAASFAASAFLPLSRSLAEGARFSPWHYLLTSDPLRNGVEWSHVGLLGLVAAVVLAVGAWAFLRRDLRG